MEHQTIKLRNFLMLMIGFVLFAWGSSSCYYDKEEELYPNPPNCDTTNITYSETIAPVLQNNCNMCHGSASPSAGIITDNYTDLKNIIDAGSFRGAINHLSGYSPMPKDENKLPECDLTKINYWLNNGAPNN
nr:hypothetical protein [Bacteroidota bacterium]